MPVPKSSRVIIADDHPLYQDALVAILTRAPDLEVLEPVATLDAALESIGATAPDLALLDLDMPGMSNTAIAKVRELHPLTRVAIISGSLAPSRIRDALSAGACGYLPKTFNPDMILAAVHLMLSGAIYVPPNALADADPASTEPTSAKDGPPSALTPREREVLEGLARGLANKEIARQLGLAEVTVKLHTRRILEKLKVRNRAAAAAVAISRGLVAGEKTE
jgi:two-component system nitrate/nitrite response regulator NarL